MKSKKIQPLLISTGDPAGIGPEICFKAIQQIVPLAGIKLIPAGNLEIMKEAAELAGLNVSPRAITLDPEDWDPASGYEILNIPLKFPAIQKGKVSKEAGEHTFHILEACSQRCLQRKAKGLVTCPINKESLELAGFGGQGHTELLSRLAGGKEVETVFSIGNLKIFFLTRHVSLQEAVHQVTKEKVLTTLIQMDRSLKSLGLKRPRIGVPGLNPHSSDGGLFGVEESKEIIPAIKKAKAHGVEAIGPIGADSIFHLGLTGEFDAILALYHDQGHIAAKTYGFHQTVTFSLGLPYLRTSVDHGTALDIAWQGKANPESLIHAIRLAVDLLKNRAGE